MCHHQKWSVPREFKLRPVNSLACLAHWRVLVALLSELEGPRRNEFRTMLEPVGKRGRQETLRFQGREEGRRDKSPKAAGRLVTWSASSEVEATSDEEQGLEAIDVHFHLDRTGRDLLGQRRGLSVDDLLDHPRAKKGVQKPVQLATYPSRVDNDPKWKVAVGVHPQHAGDFDHQQLGQLVDLLTSSPNVRALGEVGLDRTTPSHTWARQEEVLRKVITIPTDDQILMLHLRGSKGDPYGSDVQGLALRLVKETLPPTRVVHLHSFTGRASDVTQETRTYRRGVLSRTEGKGSWLEDPH
ncbi:uncharacterized protein [Haliotis cracherodii]|uniref:uncharacterized protein n=1 Tax=Haliotis cracherodii TaxID=6455 RepID=UPI0039ED86EE